MACCLRLACLVALLGSAVVLRAQTVMSLTATSSSFSKVYSSPGTLVSDQLISSANSSSNLDKSVWIDTTLPTNSQVVMGTSSPLDLVGSSTAATIQVAQNYLIGTPTTGKNAVDSSATFFRVRLANYTTNAITGSAVVLLSNTVSGTTTTIGVGANFGTTTGIFTLSSVAAPTSASTFTASAATNTNSWTTAKSGASINYSDAFGTGSVDGTGTDISSGNGDAYLTFAILNSDLGSFTFSGTTNVTVFTSSTALSAGTAASINADYISFGATSSASTNTLSFGSTSPVPEPSTWISSGMMLLAGAGLWWRRRKRAA